MPLFLSSIDANQLEIKNVALQNLSSAPGSPVTGQIWINTTSHKAEYYNGTSVVTLGTGTVTSVNISLPAEFSTGSAVTTSGSVSATWANQTANKVFASPDGSTGTPTFRALANDDIPSLTHDKISDFDDQVQTSRLDQMAAPTGDVSMNGHKLTGLANGSSSTDAVTYGQFSSAIQGLSEKPTATVAATGALPACTYDNGTSGFGATLTGDSNGALTVDGVSVAVGQLVLVMGQSSAPQNGLYDVTQPGSGGTPFILTRNADMDTAAEFKGAFVPVSNAGTSNKNTLWLCTATGSITVGSTNVNFTQLNSATALSDDGSTITISGGTVSINTSYTGQTSIVTVGTIGTGTWAGTTIAVNHGGTGSTTAAGARSNLGAMGVYSALIGDGSSTSISITQGTHGLASNGKLLVALYDASTGAQVFTDTSINNSNGTVTWSFAVAPSSNAYRAVIMG